MSTVANDPTATALLAAIRANPHDTAAQLVYADHLAESGDEGGAILTRIEAEPDVDRHRLDYAAWLEATAERVTCPRKCRPNSSGIHVVYDANTGGLFGKYPRCKRCDGTGTVPDPARLARAELVRVQCELAREPHCVNCGGKGYMGYGSYTATCKWCRPQFLNLRDRESALLREHADGWRRGPKCEACGGDGEVIGIPITMQSYKSRCRDCHGTGDLGGLMQIAAGGYGDGPYRYRVEFVRGFPTVHCALADLTAEERVTCPDCEGRTGDYRYPADDPTNRLMHGDHWYTCTTCAGLGAVTRTVPSAWLRAVVTHHRGVEFRISDREPQQWLPAIRGLPPGCAGRWFWCVDGPDSDWLSFRHYVPPPLKLSPVWTQAKWYCNTPTYDTAELAHRAHGRAVAAWGRAHPSPGMHEASDARGGQ